MSECYLTIGNRSWLYNTVGIYYKAYNKNPNVFQINDTDILIDELTTQDVLDLLLLE